ncbi:MAG: glycosyltransferase [Clostridia bacterium]|nr:glycosyltransferase [Clostridia bacterium]
MSKKTGIIGCFDGNGAAKTNIFYEQLKKRGFDDVRCVDIGCGTSYKVSVMLDIFKCIKYCEIIVVFSDCLKYLPIICFVKKIFKKRIYNNIIGGDFAQKLKGNSKYIKYLNELDANWVEFSKLAKDLTALGILNCDVISNFKEVNIKNALEKVSENGNNKFCMSGGITAESGIADAIDAVLKYNCDNQEKIRVEIWGDIDDDYKEEFESLIKHDCVEYMGCADSDKITDAITDNIAMLFPSKKQSEGFSLSLIDAYAAAVPIIASDVGANSEVIRNFETGWVYPDDNAKTLYESIKWAMEHKQEMSAMRRNCLLLSTRYKPDFVMRRLVDKYFKDLK